MDPPTSGLRKTSQLVGWLPGALLFETASLSGAGAATVAAEAAAEPLGKCGDAGRAAGADARRGRRSRGQGTMGPVKPCGAYKRQDQQFVNLLLI